MNFRGKSLSTCALALVLMFGLASSASAQLLQGSLDGNVVDSSQAAIPGATVTITNQQTGAVRTTSTGPAGASPQRTPCSAAMPSRRAAAPSARS